jgi:hypothetical protein
MSSRRKKWPKPRPGRPTRKEEPGNVAKQPESPVESVEEEPRETDVEEAEESLTTMVDSILTEHFQPPKTFSQTLRELWQKLLSRVWNRPMPLERSYKVISNDPQPDAYPYNIISLARLDKNGDPTGVSTTLTTNDLEVIKICLAGSKVRLSFQAIGGI